MYEYDPELMELVFLVRQKSAPSQSELLDDVPFSQSTLSRKLSTLEDDGMIGKLRVEGGYGLTPKAVALSDEWVDSRAKVVRQELVLP